VRRDADTIGPPLAKPFGGTCAHCRNRCREPLTGRDTPLAASHEALSEVVHTGMAPDRSGLVSKRSEATMLKLIRNFVRDEKGEDLIEYGLLAAFVAAIGVLVVYTLGLDDAIQAAFQDAIDALGTRG
jgi:Flp pilus assembly pilin Flp